MWGWVFSDHTPRLGTLSPQWSPGSSMVIARAGSGQRAWPGTQGCDTQPGTSPGKPHLWSPLLGSRESHVPSKAKAARLSSGTQERAVQGLLEGGRRLRVRAT